MEVSHRQGAEMLRRYFEKNRKDRCLKLTDLWLSYFDRGDITQADFFQGYIESEPDGGSARIDLLMRCKGWAYESGFRVEEGPIW
jgi:hypothetical protein